MTKNAHEQKTAINRPRAIASGTIFGSVDCYVLEDGSTVLSHGGMLRGLRGSDRADDGNIGRYLARLPDKYSGLSTEPNLEFIRPEGGVAAGRPARDFVTMCRAYAEMLREGTIHKARIPIAKNAIGILSYLAERGIEEMIYEATGYKRVPTPPVVQTIAVENPEVIAKVDALTALVMHMKNEIGDVQQRMASGGGFVSGCVSPHNANGIKHRLHVMGQQLARCGAAKSVASGRQKQTQHLRAVLGWTGPWKNLPLAKEAEALRELAAQERAVETIVGLMNKNRQLTLIPGGKKDTG
jgi:hypothetical protein